MKLLQSLYFCDTIAEFGNLRLVSLLFFFLRMPFVLFGYHYSLMHPAAFSSLCVYSVSPGSALFIWSSSEIEIEIGAGTGTGTGMEWNRNRNRNHWNHAMLNVVSELLILSRVMLLGRQPNNDKMSIQQPY